MDLLNCPFCGGEAVLRYDQFEDAHSVCCYVCDFAMAAFTGEREAVTAWNTRTSSEAVLVEALECIAAGDWLGVMRCEEDTDWDFLLRVITKMRAVSKAGLALAAAKEERV